MTTFINASVLLLLTVSQMFLWGLSLPSKPNGAIPPIAPPVTP